jgi:hypothetical protein
MEHKKPYKSETSNFRDYLVKFCSGYGVDVGYGGDPILPTAITIDNPNGCMAYCGDHPLNLGGDARKLKWFSNDVLDYVYSSHCLEDFEDTEEIILEWLRVIKKRGKLVLLLPNQKRYEDFCRKNNILPNEAHKIKEFGIKYIEDIISRIDIATVIYKRDFLDGYNFIVVIEKTEKSYKFKKCKWIKYLLEKLNFSKFFN